MNYDMWEQRRNGDNARIRAVLSEQIAKVSRQKIRTCRTQQIQNRLSVCEGINKLEHLHMYPIQQKKKGWSRQKVRAEKSSTF